MRSKFQLNDVTKNWEHFCDIYFEQVFIKVAWWILGSHIWVSTITLILETSKDGVLILSKSLSSSWVYFGDTFWVVTTTSILETSYDGVVSKYFTSVIILQSKVRRRSIATRFNCISQPLLMVLFINRQLKQMLHAADTIRLR